MEKFKYRRRLWVFNEYFHLWIDFPIKIYFSFLNRNTNRMFYANFHLIRVWFTRNLLFHFLIHPRDRHTLQMVTLAHINNTKTPSCFPQNGKYIVLWVIINQNTLRFACFITKNDKRNSHAHVYASDCLDNKYFFVFFLYKHLKLSYTHIDNNHKITWKSLKFLIVCLEKFE